MTVAFHVLSVVLIAALFRKLLKQRAAIADSECQLHAVTAKLETSEMSYKALLVRANDLAKEKVQASRLAAEVAQYIGRIGGDIKELLSRHQAARRALEHIASYPVPNVIESSGAARERDRFHALRNIAQETLDALGLTLIGTVEAAAAQMVQEPLPEGFAGKYVDNFVCDDNRNAKVDLSGQAARIRAQLKETAGKLQAAYARPLGDDPNAGPLRIASERLGTNDLAIDLVKHEGQSQPSLAIVVEGTPDDFAPSTVGKQE